MRTVLTLCCAALLVAACDWQRFSPHADPCRWVETNWKLHPDTGWNQVPITAIPDSLKYLWMPFFVIQNRVATDSAWTCR